jgi:hypothetical protein
MTLILGLANQQQVVLISDRRLLCDGKVVEDESNKAATLNLQDARLAVAFTGLAQTGTFLTRRWLLEALLKSADPDHRMEPTIKRFCDRATRDFAKIVARKKSDKCLTVVLAGYCYNEATPRCYYWLVSNFEGLTDELGILAEPLDEFRIHWCREKRPSEESSSLIFAAGTYIALSQHHIHSLRTLLQENKRASALVGKGVEVLRAVAMSPLSKNHVGKQCTSIVLPSSPDASCSLEYHSDTLKTRVFAPSTIEARGGGHATFIIDSPEIEIRDPSGRSSILVVPKVGPNHPCPCGSGKKYKKCCGSSAAHRGAKSMTLHFGRE